MNARSSSSFVPRYDACCVSGFAFTSDDCAAPGISPGILEDGALPDGGVAVAGGRLLRLGCCPVCALACAAKSTASSISDSKARLAGMRDVRVRSILQWRIIRKD